MQNIVIDKKGCQLYSERDILMVKHTSLAKTLSIPFSQIQSLTITSQVDLSSHLLTRLAEHHVSVCVLPSGRTGEACFLLGSWHAGIERRQSQYDIVNQDTAKSYWAATLVRLKLHQQASTLNTLQQYYDAGLATSALQEPSTTLTATRKIKSLRDKFRKYYYSTDNLATHPSGSAIDTNTPISVYDRYMPQYPVASILGTEGIGSAIYFKCYQRFLPKNGSLMIVIDAHPKTPSMWCCPCLIHCYNTYANKRYTVSDSTLIMACCTAQAMAGTHWLVTLQSYNAVPLTYGFGNCLSKRLSRLMILVRQIKAITRASY